MTRQVIKQPAKLHGKDLQSYRQRHNAAVIIGMKHPRISLHEVLGHREVGNQAAKAIDKFSEANPHAQAAMTKAIGDTTKANKGPEASDIAKVRKLVE